MERDAEKPVAGAAQLAGCTARGAPENLGHAQKLYCGHGSKGPEEEGQTSVDIYRHFTYRTLGLPSSCVIYGLETSS